MNSLTGTLTRSIPEGKSLAN